MKGKILSVSIILLCVLSLFRFAGNNAEEEDTKPVVKQDQIIPDNINADTYETESEWQNLLRQDRRLFLVGQITYPYQNSVNFSTSFGIDEFRSGQEIYSETEISETPFAIFDEENRLVYALNLTSGISNEKKAYTYPVYEENFFERDDEEHTCRHIYYQSNARLYDLINDSFLYVSSRKMQEVEYWQFSENGNLISYLYYSPDHVGVSTHSSTYDTKLYFNNGYQAEYDGEYLMSEILWRQGNWTYHTYQYDDAGNRILEIVVADYTVTLAAYEYDDKAGQVTRYDYLVKENKEWEMNCKDGTAYSFYSAFSDRYTRPAVRKTAADGTVLTELFYKKPCDIGQEEYLMAQEIEENANLHQYITIQPGDSLWSIAEQYYGNGCYNDILYQANQDIIGANKDKLQPGMRLYIPKIWAVKDDYFHHF